MIRRVHHTLFHRGDSLARPVPMRRAGALFLLFVLVLPALLFVPVARGTDVAAGDITLNTTWNRGGSPYYIRGNVRVAFNVTLSIEPGVDVLFAGNYSLGSGSGRIFANGTPAEPVTFAPAADNGKSWQWGLLETNGMHDCRVIGGERVNAGPMYRCAIERTWAGVLIYGGYGERFENLTIRQSETFALEVAGAFNCTFSNITIDRAKVGVALVHVGHPDTGADPMGNTFSHLTVSNFTQGVRVNGGWPYPPPKTNLLTKSVFRDGGVTFPTSFSGHVYANNIANTTGDFGFPAADGIGDYDDGARGNYWSNYTGTDANYDGIGDSVYGPDRHPLMVLVPDAGARPYDLPIVPSAAPILGPLIVGLLVTLIVVPTILVLLLGRRRANRGRGVR